MSNPTTRILDSMDPPTGALLGVAGAIAVGNEPLLEERARMLLATGAAPVWVEELLLQSVLMVGYPRALVAAGVWRRVSGLSAPSRDADSTGPEEWLSRGEETCQAIYGFNYDRLRANVRQLHPALDTWMVTEGYGRVMARDGLDLARRELCTVVQLAVLGSPRQLHSHLRGALQVGAGSGVIDRALEIAGRDASPAAATEAAAVWQQVRKMRETT